MKKVLLFIVALLALYSCSRNAVETENEYEVIAVLHNRTNKWIVVDTLDIIYTEREALNYAGCRIPEKFADISEEFCVYTRYYDYVDKKEARNLYKLWFTAIDGNKRWCKYEKLK